MMFLSLAFVFAGLNNVFGQEVTTPKTLDLKYLDAADITCVQANPLTCIAGAGPLNPVPGITYTYAIKDDAAGAESDITDVQWFVYNATATTATPAGYGPNIIVDGVITAALDNMEDNDGTSLFLLEAEGHYGAMTSLTDNADAKEIDISWQSFDGSTNEILLVAFVQGDCADNIQVYRIQPAFSFTLDIAGLMPDGTLNYQLDGDGNPTETIIPAVECVSPVWSATYTPGTPELTVDYGGNYVFFVVNAANFVNSWQPTFGATVDAVAAAAGTTVREIAWAYPDQAILGNETDGATGAWNVADASGVAAAVTVQREVSEGVKADAADDAGECIVVRVLVEHGENETLAQTIVTLGVNGIMYDQADDTDRYGNEDLADVDEGNPDCTQPGVNEADYNLTPRPEVVTNTEPGEDAGDQDPFEPKNP